MKTSILLASLLVLAAAAPVASAHGPLEPTPQPGPKEPCELLPLWDGAMCALDGATPYATAWAAWSVDQTFLAAHYVGCHIVGGPGCLILPVDEVTL